jgi:hypothetical protein
MSQTELPNYSLNLKNAVPSDRPHLLLWEKQQRPELWQLAFNSNAEVVSYRENLLNRIEGDAKFLRLDRRLDAEFRAIKDICTNSPKPIVILEEIDCLVTYLKALYPDAYHLFWRKLIDLRHLERILWIVLPPKLCWSEWSKTQLLDLTSSGSINQISE